MARGRGRDPSPEVLEPDPPLFRGASQLSLHSCCLLVRLLRGRLKPPWKAEAKSNSEDSDATGGQVGVLEMRASSVASCRCSRGQFCWRADLRIHFYGLASVMLQGQRWEREEVNLVPLPAWKGDVALSLGTKRPYFLQMAGCAGWLHSALRRLLILLSALRRSAIHPDMCPLWDLLCVFEDSSVLLAHLSGAGVSSESSLTRPGDSAGPAFITSDRLKASFSLCLQAICKVTGSDSQIKKKAANCSVD